MKYISGVFAIAILIALLSCEKKEDLKEPVAAFCVDPCEGTVSTVFYFDASDSYDESNSPEDLKVRWDWDGDLVFDTEYSQAKKISHRFDHPGIYNVVMEVSNLDGWSSRESTVIDITADSIPPKASFFVMPDTSSVNTIFMFNAASSFDPINSISELMFRWDWNNDGIWDTPYMSDTVFYNQFNDFGDYRIILEVKNSIALTDTTGRKIFVYDI